MGDYTRGFPTFLSEPGRPQPLHTDGRTQVLNPAILEAKNPQTAKDPQSQTVRSEAPTVQTRRPPDFQSNKEEDQVEHEFLRGHYGGKDYDRRHFAGSDEGVWFSRPQTFSRSKTRFFVEAPELATRSLKNRMDVFTIEPQIVTYIILRAPYSKYTIKEPKTLF